MSATGSEASWFSLLNQIKLTPLISDYFLWGLVLFLFISFLLSCRNPANKEAWLNVFKKPAAVASLAFLLVFLLIGLADSIHYRKPLDQPQDLATTLAEQNNEPKRTAYSVEISLLDDLLTHLKERQEKTYSAPLAIYAYAKEPINVELADGSHRLLRDFPRLRYGGANLGEETRRWQGDIAKRINKALGTTMVLSFLILQLIVVFAAKIDQATWSLTVKKILSGKTAIAWRALWLSLSLIIFIFSVLYYISLDYHPLGTDKIGEDILYQALKSIRTALVIGLVTTIVLLPLALILGILAGYFRGWVDDLIQYIYTTINSIPSVLLIAAAVLMMQVIIDVHPEWFDTSAERADTRLLALCVILGMTSWTSLARLLRGETLKLRELEYVQAARAFGVSNFRILARHITPNLMHIIIITIVMDFSGLVLAEAVLSYIGIGVDPMMQSFGSMINNARMELSREPMVWWTLAAAFAFMFILVLAANLLADAVRDAFDPRLRTYS